MLDKLFSVALVATAGAVAASVAAMKKKKYLPGVRSKKGNRQNRRPYPFRLNV